MTEPMQGEGVPGWSRRGVLAVLGGLGLGATGLADAVWALARARPDEPLTRDMLRDAERIAGLSFTDEERELMLRGLGDLRESYRRIRETKIGNDVPPAFRFDPRSAGTEGGIPPAGSSRAAAPASSPAAPAAGASAVAPASSGSAGGSSGPSPVAAAPGAEPTPVASPASERDLAFLSVAELHALLRERKVRSADLTRLYLDRLERADVRLHCVITRTEERALEAADRADRELDAGRVRGPLHGIPWGAKDLLAARGYPTTWGAAPYREQRIDEDATVVARLEEAGAVLVAKLSCGALAWGDVWFGGKTRNPWNPEQGSSGSSAGSAAAAAAGLVGFALGTETWGSIVSPCTRCGATGLRPTFGRVSRHGCMALSWTMDKVGPIARSVEDCAMVLEAIAGPDGEDPGATAPPFRLERDLDPSDLSLGYVPELFEDEPDSDEGKEWRRFDRDALLVLRGLGIRMVPVRLPELPVTALSFVLNVEAAAAFDELTRSGRDDEMVRQIENAWPNVFRRAHLVPAVEYVQAQRLRTLVMRDLERRLGDLDGWVTPTYGGDNLLLTNLTGHPAIVVPSGFRGDGTPVSLTFNGRLDGESRLVAIARAFQEATGYHRRHPALPG